jgi:TetR/AcrR family transcriptional regulator, tetracycline repressor protein
MADKRTQLSRELITNVAVDVVARDGLGALSMRRLAQELDVWPMSVYRHFRDKDDLLDAVAAAGAEGVDLPPDEGSWRDQLPALAEEARVLLARQPIDLRRRTLISPGVLRLTDAALRVMREGGFEPAAAATAWRAVLAYVVGSIEFEAATGTERETQAAIVAVPEEEHPDLSAAAEEVAHALAGGDAAFDEGLERVLAGIAPNGP